MQVKISHLASSLPFRRAHSEIRQLLYLHSYFLHAPGEPKRERDGEMGRIRTDFNPSNGQQFP